MRQCISLCIGIEPFQPEASGQDLFWVDRVSVTAASAVLASCDTALERSFAVDAAVCQAALAADLIAPKLKLDFILSDREYC